jgi:hypothetical protein
MEADDKLTETATKLDVHLAECALRYANISSQLADGSKVMDRLQVLIGILTIAVLLGPGFAAELIKKLIGG